MRASFDLRITLTESESTAIAVAAYYAQQPITEWVKQKLLNHTAPPVELPTPATATAIAPQPPPPQAIPAAIPEPVAPVAPVSRAVEPPQPAPPAPEPEPPASPAVSTKKRRKRVASAAKPGMPRGFYAIMEMAEKIHAGRMQVINETNATRGHAYVVRMSQWYKDAGFGDLDNTTRNQLSLIGRNADAIRAWHSKHPGTVASDILPYALFRDWQADGGVPVKLEPEETTADEPTAEPLRPNDETIVFSATGIRKRSLSEITAGNGAEPVEDHVDEIPPSSPTRYDNFGTVDFAKLAPYDARQLRRFTERIVNLGGAEVTLPEEKIALAIRKIRGNESGDTPPVVHALSRMGVIAGPTVHRLRREYCERFPDVRKWADV